jgi:hypothetical protein
VNLKAYPIVLRQIGHKLHSHFFAVKENNPQIRPASTEPLKSARILLQHLHLTPITLTWKREKKKKSGGGVQQKGYTNNTMKLAAE